MPFSAKSKHAFELSSAITPYYLSLIQNFNKSDPIYLQCIPQIDELYYGGKIDKDLSVNIPDR